MSSILFLIIYIIKQNILEESDRNFDEIIDNFIHAKNRKKAISTTSSGDSSEAETFKHDVNFEINVNNFDIC